MFNLSDTIKFSLFVYNNNNESISSSRIPKDIDLNFSLKEETKFVEVKEYIEVKGLPTLGTILKIYLGNEITLNDLIKVIEKNSGKIKINDSLNLNVEGIYEKRLLVETTPNGEMYVSKILEENEIAIKSLDEMEKYIRQLSCKLSTLKRQESDIKRLMKRK